MTEPQVRADRSVRRAGPERPVRAMLYDFGPGATQVQPATRMAPLAVRHTATDAVA